MLARLQIAEPTAAQSRFPFGRGREAPGERVLYSSSFILE
jgi:hypothetical protein